MDIGSFISAVIYFVIFMAVIYFLIIVPYKHVQARRGQVVFGDPAPVKTCPRACPAICLPPRPSASTAARISPPPPPPDAAARACMAQDKPAGAVRPLVATIGETSNLIWSKG